MTLGAGFLTLRSRNPPSLEIKIVDYCNQEMTKVTKESLLCMDSMQEFIFTVY